MILSPKFTTVVQVKKVQINFLRLFYTLLVSVTGAESLASIMPRGNARQKKSFICFFRSFYVTHVYSAVCSTVEAFLTHAILFAQSFWDVRPITWYVVRDRSQTLVRGGLRRKGALKLFEPCKGGPEKIAKDFPLKIEFTCFSMGLTHNFHGKKGGGDLNFFCGLKGAPKNFRDKYFLHQAPLTSVCERSLTHQ